MKAALIVVLCVASSMLVNAIPLIVVGRNAIIPFPVKNCVATNLESGQIPAVDCEVGNPLSGEPYLRIGTTLKLPTGQFGRCEFTADEEGKIVEACVGIPQVNVRDEPTIKDGVATLPTTAKSCVLTNIHRCPGNVVLTPSITCTDAGPNDPKFREGETFDFSDGSFGRCEVRADADGSALPACVGIAVAAVPPASINGDGTITLPQGAVSCSVSFAEQGQAPFVSCTAPTLGCGQAVFKAGVVVGLPVGVTGSKCTFQANPNGTANIASCSL